MLSDQMRYLAAAARHEHLVRDRGVYPDIPYELIRTTWTAQRAADDAPGMGLEGDFGEDGARERAGTNHP
jgi:hypothetical protein